MHQAEAWATERFVLYLGPCVDRVMGFGFVRMHGFWEMCVLTSVSISRLADGASAVSGGQSLPTGLRTGGLDEAPAQPGESQKVLYGIDPQVLLASGILRNPAIPEQALERAKSLCAQARYREARATLVPHINTPERALDAKLRGVLAECALHGGGAEPRAAIADALERFENQGQTEAAAHMRVLLAELLIQTGDFVDAQRNLAQARRVFRESSLDRQVTHASALIARLTLLRGDSNAALSEVEIASEEAGVGTQAAALIRLERARIHAYRNDPNKVARDLVEAERILRSRMSLALRLQPRIVRAETLNILGYRSRALRGLRKLLIDVVTLEDTQLRARVHLLLGNSAIDEDATFARRYLMRARHLYETFGGEYGAAEADIGLVRVEQRLGLNPRSRLEALESRDLSKWNLLTSKLAIAKAEIFAGSRPAVIRRGLLEARERAAENGLRAVMAQLDETLRRYGLVEDHGIELTPVEKRRRAREPRCRHQPLPTAFTEADPEPAVNIVPTKARSVSLEGSPRNDVRQKRTA